MARTCLDCEHIRAGYCSTGDKEGIYSMCHFGVWKPDLWANEETLRRSLAKAQDCPAFQQAAWASYDGAVGGFLG